jgi:hypothetical protein
MGKVLMSGVVPKLKAPSVFPEEPTSYNLISIHTNTQVIKAPEDGWFQLEIHGKSGDGGYGTQQEWYDSDNDLYMRYTAGHGGGGGCYVLSNLIKLFKDDEIHLTVDTNGNITVEIHSTTGETYNTMSAISGLSNRTGGKASGGNVSNIDGGTGGTGGAKSDYDYGNNSKVKAIGGSGGAPAHPEGNAGGRGSDSSYNNFQNQNRTLGSIGRLNFYRGNTNDANDDVVVEQPDLYLLSNADRCTDVTGGWTITHKFQDNCTITSGINNCIRLSLANVIYGGGGTVSTVNKIDVTEYSKLVATYRQLMSGGLTGVHFGLYSATGGGVDDNVVRKTSTSADGTLPIEVDVSDLTGSYHVCFYADFGSNEYCDLFTVKLVK